VLKQPDSATHASNGETQPIHADAC
jgi:hypothetical protein